MLLVGTTCRKSYPSFHMRAEKGQVIRRRSAATSGVPGSDMVLGWLHSQTPFHCLPWPLSTRPGEGSQAGPHGGLLTSGSEGGERRGQSSNSLDEPPDLAMKLLGSSGE